MSLSVFKDENLKGKEKAIFLIFPVMKFFEHNITYCKLINESRLNSIMSIMSSSPMYFLTDTEIQHSIKKC